MKERTIHVFITIIITLTVLLLTVPSLFGFSPVVGLFWVLAVFGGFLIFCIIAGQYIEYAGWRKEE